MALSIMNSISTALRHSANLGNQISRLPGIQRGREIKAADATLAANAKQLAQMEKYSRGRRFNPDERTRFLQKVDEIRRQNSQAWSTKQKYNPSDENFSGYMSGGISGYIARKEKALQRMKDQQEFRKEQAGNAANRKHDLSNLSVGGVKFDQLPPNMQKILKEEHTRRPFNGN